MARRSKRRSKFLVAQSPKVLVEEFSKPTNPSFRDVNDKLTSSIKSIRYSFTSDGIVGNAVSASFSSLNKDFKQLFPVPAPSKTERAIDHTLVDIGDVFKLRDQTPNHVNMVDLAVGFALRGIHRVFENPLDW